jgi:hypothetical protein
VAALDTYLQFILDYAPYFYYIPGTGVDTGAGRGVAAAAFSIDFLYEAYDSGKFESEKINIYNKIVSLADWILTQQCVDEDLPNYGGFKSNENSDYYYSIDACRVIPSLLRAYELIQDTDYLTAAVLAGKTFLKTMQDKQTQGGFARAIYNIVKEGSWQVAANTDDCEVEDTDATHPPWVNLNDVYNPWVGLWSDLWWGAGQRFLDVFGTILGEAKIKSAHLKVCAYVDQAASPDLKSRIEGEKGNSETFSNVANYNARTRTAAKVDWDGMGSWLKDQWYLSPDIRTVIQEVLDAGLSSDLVIFWEDDGTTTPTQRRSIYNRNADSTKAPKLEVEWVEVNWLLQMDVECLYGLIGLKMLCSYDPDNKSQYESMMEKLVDFLREGFEGLWLYYEPSDSSWHRVGLTENEIYDDCFAYALLGLYDHESWSLSCEKVYELINTIPASADYPGYNSHICWAGYIDVVKRKSACDYYDAVTSGILLGIRAVKDKPSLELSVQIINLHYEEFMFWGVKFFDWSPVENKQSIITVSWLGLLLLRYKAVRTLFAPVLNAGGENVTLYSIVQSGETVSYSEGITIKAVVKSALADEVVIEPGFMVTDFIKVYTLVPVRHHDKIMRNGVDYEVGSPQVFRFKGEPQYYAALCRRLVQ